MIIGGLIWSLKRFSKYIFGFGSCMPEAKYGRKWLHARQSVADCNLVKPLQFPRKLISSGV